MNRKPLRRRVSPLRPLRLPPTTKFVTSTGIRTVVAQRGQIPLVSIRLVLRAGGALDPATKHGLADFTARLLRRGTRSLGVDALNEQVEFVGGSLGTSASEDLMVLGITSPSEHLGPMLDVLGRLVSEPAFAPDEVKKTRERVLAQLANDLDDPGLLADKALGRALWGDHPYGHDLAGQRAHVLSFEREDVVRFHSEKMGPRVALLVVVGAVAPARVREHCERAFAQFTGGPSEAALPAVPRQAVYSGRVLLVDKPEQNQSQIRLGGLAFPKGHPDQIPAHVMNTTLGGGFTSRLVNEIRVNRGLSYGVGSHFDALQHGGAFAISSFTKSETTAELIEVALEQVSRMRSRGPTGAELEAAKRYIGGLYPLRLETNESVGSALAEIHLYGLGEDWVERYRERLNAVTLAQAREVATRYLYPDAPAVVVVGNADAVRKQVERFGKVQVMKATELE